MVPFSFAEIAGFPLPDLEAADVTPSIVDLEKRRRHEALFVNADPSSIDWLARATEYFHDIGAYGESQAHAEKLAARAEEAGDRRNLIKAYLFQALCAISTDNKDRIRQFTDLLAGMERRSSEPYLRAVRLFVQSFGLEKGIPPELLSPAGLGDSSFDVFDSFKKAAMLFLAEGEVDFAIWCHVEYGGGKVVHGQYITAIQSVERALSLAKRHDAWKWTGRMLQIATAAATDQGYRRHVQETIHRSIAWSDYVGDPWGRIEGLITMGRLLSFEIPSLEPLAAVEPDRYLQQARSEAEQFGVPWPRRRAENAREFLRTKSGIDVQKPAVVNALVVGEAWDHVDQEVRRRIATRLQDGISDFPDAFFVFNALRNEDMECRDFLNEYRNLAGGEILGIHQYTVALLSEISDNPYFAGLGDALHIAADKRKAYQDIVEIRHGGDPLSFQRRVVPSGDGAVITFRNVTAERRIEEALLAAADSAVRSERTMSEFLANMSHEIRTPISGVLGLARMLAETSLEDLQRSYVKSIIGSGDILLGLIGDVLDMSKLEAGFIEIVPGPVVLRELFSGIAGLYSGQAAEKGVAVQVEVADDVPAAVLADGVRLRQILANLVGNAVKFTETGSITIRATTNDGELVCEVADTGVGIPADSLKSIFEPFRQATRGKSSAGGTGLGLTISKRLVELMGGTISVSSEANLGSRFVIRLPLKEVEGAILEAAVETPTRFDGIRVLLVEDNEVNLIVSYHALSKLGCEVITATDGLQALHALQDGHFDVVFMDVRMPGLDGLETTREIRLREHGTGKKRIPVIALTAGALSEERDDCFAAGMDDYVSKPFTDLALRNALAKLPAK